ncbi:hypothetical protein MRB53_028779 [Persea americana]|uniref:Uncharacterized protein n=1 Tax=Persea americana TaxID=3435 RepID=A0ACC2KGH9_PERAE|nr:hypothetical protein MRB53_028779 [Persea americana]
MADLKARYRIVKALREQSGFGWDDLMQICIADEDVWNRYIQAHPEAKAYRRTSFPLYDNLSIIYDGCTAEGKQQKSSRVPITQPCVEEQIPIQICATPAISQPPSNERVEEEQVKLNMLTVAAVAGWYIDTYLDKKPCRDSTLSGATYVNELLIGHLERFRQVKAGGSVVLCAELILCDGIANVLCQRLLKVGTLTTARCFCISDAEVSVKSED